MMDPSFLAGELIDSWERHSEVEVEGQRIPESTFLMNEARLLDITEILPHLRAFLQSNRWQERARASFCIATLGGDARSQEASRVLLEHFANETTTSVLKGMEWMRGLPPVGGFDPSRLAHHLQAKTKQVQYSVLYAIGTVEGDTAEDMICGVLCATQDPWMVVDAAQAIKRIGTKRCLIALEQAGKISGRHSQDARGSVQHAMNVIRARYGMAPVAVKGAPVPP